jgi:hypothetical protein
MQTLGSPFSFLEVKYSIGYSNKLWEILRETRDFCMATDLCFPPSLDFKKIQRVDLSLTP